jgi:predicted outer membrane repeat protein
VDRTDDSASAEAQACLDDVPNDCTLRGAILAANAGVARAAAAGLAGGVLIELPAGEYTLSLVGDDNNSAAGDLDIILVDLTIRGAGVGATIIQAGPTPGSGIDRIFNIHSASLTLENLTARHGQARSDPFSYGGGVVSFWFSTLTLNNVLLTDNIGRQGGGAIFGGNGHVIINNSTLSNNQASGFGGAIFVQGCQISATNSTFSGNRAGSYGGAIYNYASSNTVLQHTTFSGNSANNGSALTNYCSSMISINDTIIANAGTRCCSGGSFSGDNNLIADSSCSVGNGGAVTCFDGTLSGMVHPLLAGSNAIDAGTCAVSRDQRGMPRPRDGDGNGVAQCDVGAYEYDGPAATPTPVANLAIEHLEVTQAIQRDDNSVPLVAGRPAVARVTLQHTAPSAIGDVTVELHGLRGGAELPGSPLREEGFNAPTDPNGANLNDTVNFQLPEVWVQEGTLTVWAEVNPDQSLAETDYSDNRGDDIALEVAGVPPLAVVLIPIAYQENGEGPTYRPDMGPENAYGLKGLQEVYPIPGVATIPHSEFYFDGDLTAPTGAECRPEWNRLLGLLKQLRLQERPGEKATGGSRVMPKYYGVLPSEAACFGGLGYLPGAVSMGLVYQDKVSAHEIGHNLSLKHVDSTVCGQNPGSLDNDYPHADASIGYVGLDVYDLRTYSPEVSRDVMSYCRPQWISDYHYEKMMGELLPVTAQEASARLVLQEPMDALIVTGQIAADGQSGELDNALPLQATVVDQPPGGGDFRLDMVDDAGITQLSYGFDPVEIDPTVPETPLGFDFVLPLIDNLGRIELWKDDLLLDTLLASPAPQIEAEVEFLDASAFRVTWTVEGSEDVAVTLRYSPDGGQSWQVLAMMQTGDTFESSTGILAASDNGLLEVVASDRTSSSTVLLELGPIADKQPVVGIAGKRLLKVAVGESIRLWGNGMDLEDGSLPDGALAWYDDPGLLLGTGRMVELPLGMPQGVHTITLRGSDSYGNVSEDQVTVVAGGRLYLPLVTMGPEIAPVPTPSSAE